MRKTMSDIQENTEAKLAAYIDGDLDGSDRAEIEKLLEQNPNYRRVLDQLRQTRQLLRGLPRESAPPELCEIFNSQLERSVLLDGITEQRPRSGPLNRWPQFMMAAAVVLLTVGLGTVVYFVLPKSRPPLRVAQNSAAPGAGLYDAQPTSAEDEEDLYDRSPNSSLAGGQPPRDAAIVPGLGVTAADPSSEVGELALDAYQNPQVQSLLYETSGANTATPSNAENPKDALVMVVRSNDPQELQKQVVAYLDANSISWSAAPQQVPVTLNLTMAQSNKDVAEAVSPWQRILGSNASGGAIQPAPEQAQINRRGVQLTTQPTTQEASALASQAEVNAPQIRQSLDQQLAKKARALSVNNVYVARRLSRVQLVELSDTLTGKSQAGQSQYQQVQLENVSQAYRYRMQDGMAKAALPTQAATEPTLRQGVALGRMNFAAQQQVAAVARPSTEPAQSQPSAAAQPIQQGNGVNFVEGVRYFRGEASALATRPTTEAFLMADSRPAPTTMPADALYLVLVVQNEAPLAPTTQDTLERSAQPPATQPVPANPQ